MEYTTMYDDTKEEIIAKLKVLSDTKRMILLKNTHGRQKIYTALSARRKTSIS